MTATKEQSPQANGALPHEQAYERANERLWRDYHTAIAPDWKTLDGAELGHRLEYSVGGTPMEKIYLGGRNDVLLKQEYTNLSGSHYDRIYISTIHELESQHCIKPGDELRDITSGSAGISLAMIGELLGYNVRITVPEELPENRLAPMKYFGAEVVNAGPGYVPTASAKQAQEIMAFKRDPSWIETRPDANCASSFIFEKDGKRICYLNHSENQISVTGFEYLGMEIGLSREWDKQVDPPTALLLAAGNWTSIAGISPVIREILPSTKIIAYEGTHTSGAHDNYGTSVDGLRLKYKELSLVDDIVQVPNRLRDYMDELINPGRDMYHQLGHSSLMGLGLAKEMMDADPDTRIVTIGYDQKYRY